MERLWTRNYLLLLCSNTVTNLSFSVFVALVPLYVAQLGGDNALAGSMAGTLMMAMMVSRPVCGFLMDRFGRWPLIMLGGALFTLNTVGYFFAAALPVLFFLRVSHGVTTCLYGTSTSTMIADVLPAGRMVDGIGYYQITVSLANATGPVIGSWIWMRWGFFPLFVLMTVLSVLGTALPLLISRDCRKMPASAPEQSTVRRRFAVLELAAVAPAAVSGLLFMGQSAVNNFLPSYGLFRGIAGISLFFVCNGVLLVIARLFSPRLFRRLGHRPVILCGFALMLAGYLLVAAAGSLAPIIVAGILSGAGEGVLRPVLHAAVFQLSPPERRGMANATFGIFNDIGNGSGAALWGFLSVGAGFAATYLLAALCIGLAGIAYLLVLRPRLSDGFFGAG